MKREAIKYWLGDDNFTAFKSYLSGALKISKSKSDLAQLVNDICLYCFSERSINSSITTFYNVKTFLDEVNTKKASELNALLRIPKKIFDFRNKEYKEKQVEKLAKETNIDTIQIVSNKIDELYDKIDDNNFLASFASTRQTIDDIKAYASVAILAFYTGRRLSEILNTLEIHKRGDKVFVNGLLKKDEVNKEFELCLFKDIDIRKLQNLLRFVRKHFRVDETIAEAKTVKLQNQLLNKKYNAIINKNIRKILDIDNLTVHDLRAYYAEICFKESGEKIENKNEFIAKVLGHDFSAAQTAYKNRAKKNKRSKR